MENIKEKIENSAIDCINNGVTGRLIIFKPEKSNLGADLAIERRGKYKEKEIYFQINSIVGKPKDNIFVKDFFQDDFKTDKNFYLLFVDFDEVAQKLSEFVWLVPSIQFRDIAETAKSDNNKKLLRFQTSLDIKQKNKYSRFAIKTQELGKTVLSALENGGKFDFKEVDFEEKNVINMETLKEFIVMARQNTYAANVTPLENPRLIASTQLEFQKGNLFYRDVYFSGYKQFMGQEIVYQDSKPIWGMNYSGNQIGKLETAFLKESLFRLAEKCRFGGVCEYEKREYKYQDRGEGKLENFFGREEMFLNGKDIYKLNYQGGLI